ncbi:MAG: hypothetical protein IPP72_02790 [Chitinophagaceae bacterium]|nr:hypothetical protein [Chitinophagaceae bacterium]
MKRITIFLLGLIPCVAMAQNVGIGTTTPNASAQLEIQSASKGLLIPRMLDAQMRAIVAPAKGLLVFNSTDSSFYMRRDSGWVNINAANSIGAWSLKGNANTDTAKNFIGTTDLNAVVLKVNGKRAGMIEDTLAPHLSNVALGLGAMSANIFGYENTAVGSMALNKNDAGVNNVAVGNNALRHQVFSNLNTAIGGYSMDSSLSGNQNTAVGYLSLFNNNGGSNNVALGLSTLRSNTTGGSNLAAGTGALQANASGAANTAAGVQALIRNTTGNRNVAVGYRALFSNMLGSNLVAIGDSALFNNLGSAATGISGLANTAVGSKALYKNTTGYSNTAIGFNALDSNETGFSNTAIGSSALLQNESGSSNVVIGYNAGIALQGSTNTIIGSLAGTFLGNNSGNVFIGHRAGQLSRSSNKLYIENTLNDSTTALIYGDFAGDSLRFNANTNITGYARLGNRTELAPAIKMKKLTINLPSIQGASAFVTHGLNQAKILSVSALATIGIFEIPASFLQPGFQFTVNADNGRIAVNTVAAQSASVLNAPVKILIIYEE